LNQNRGPDSWFSGISEPFGVSTSLKIPIEYQAMATAQSRTALSRIFAMRLMPFQQYVDIIRNNQPWAFRHFVHK
jgi:hypothetical protein